MNSLWFYTIVIIVITLALLTIVWLLSEARPTSPQGRAFLPQGLRYGMFFLLRKSYLSYFNWIVCYIAYNYISYSKKQRSTYVSRPVSSCRSQSLVKERRSSAICGCGFIINGATKAAISLGLWSFIF